MAADNKKHETGAGGPKRTAAMAPGDVQAASEAWWCSRPMTYEWRGEVSLTPLSRDWFDAIDERFLHGARLFATAAKPFDRIIPLDKLAGCSVLEIGCGMGLHTETMVRAGAAVTAIDFDSDGSAGHRAPPGDQRARGQGDASGRRVSAIRL